MKKFLTGVFCIILCLCMGLALSACANGEPSQTPDDTPSGETPSDPSGEPSDPSSETPAEWGDVLVVYFSATGNTEEVAGFIAAGTGGDTFELVPVQPYTQEDLRWTDENSRVVREHNDPSLQNVALTASTVENWVDYETVFVGYPIWWHEAAWPVNTFIRANDFTGKTVIPFCTSSSSDLGNSGTLLAEMAGTGNWLEGRRFGSSGQEQAVASWLDSLGF